MANHKVHLVAKNCGSPRNNKQQNNIKATVVGKNPAAKSRESPGKNGKKTTPVSIKTIRKTKPYAARGPVAIIEQ